MAPSHNGWCEPQGLHQYLAQNSKGQAQHRQARHQRCTQRLHPIHQGLCAEQATRPCRIPRGQCLFARQYQRAHLKGQQVQRYGGQRIGIGSSDTTSHHVAAQPCAGCHGSRQWQRPPRIKPQNMSAATPRASYSRTRDSSLRNPRRSAHNICIAIARSRPEHGNAVSSPRSRRSVPMRTANKAAPAKAISMESITDSIRSMAGSFRTCVAAWAALRKGGMASCAVTEQ
jgi:hypothetical protein